MRSTRGGDSGSSLVEAMLAVTILGIGVAAILTGILTSLTESDRSRGQAEANAVLVASIESLRDTVPFSAGCPTTYDIPALVSGGQIVLPAGWPADSLEIERVAYWDGNAFVASCPGTLPVQLLTVRVTNPGHHAATTATTILKRAQ